MQVISRKQAKADGRLRYFTGMVCKGGHVDERLVSNGACLACCREGMAAKREAKRRPKVVSPRREALNAGRVRYSTGKPCPKGHMAERFASSGRCVQCCDEAQRLLLETNPQRHRDANRRWSENNPEKTRAMKRPANANRRASQLQRTPCWLTPEDWKRIKVKHAEARWMTVRTGIPHAVDHIYPLQGRLVSGLHVPANMRVIPARENSRKHNKMPEAHQ